MPINIVRNMLLATVSMPFGLADAAETVEEYMKIHTDGSSQAQSRASASVEMLDKYAVQAENSDKSYFDSVAWMRKAPADSSFEQYEPRISKVSTDAGSRKLAS